MEDGLDPMDYPDAKQETEDVEVIEANGELRTYKVQRTPGERAAERSRSEKAVRGDDSFREHTRRAIVRINEIIDKAVSFLAIQELDSAN